MNRKLVSVVVLVLAVELAGLILAGVYIGFAVAIWYAMLTVILGIGVARKEGMKLGQAWQQAMGSGRVPDKRFFASAMLLGAGVLLAIPGLISDALALALFIPPLRQLIAAKVQSKLAKQMQGIMANPAAFMSQFGDLAARAQAQAGNRNASTPGANMFSNAWMGGKNPGGGKLGGIGQVIDTQATRSESESKR